MNVDLFMLLGQAGGGESKRFWLPVDDWQFWVATAIFLFAAAWLLRGVLPIPILSRGKRRHKRGERKATLTISGKPIEKR